MDVSFLALFLLWYSLTPLPVEPVLVDADIVAYWCKWLAGSIDVDVLSNIRTCSYPSYLSCCGGLG